MNKYIKVLTLAGLVTAAGCVVNPVPPDYYAGIVKELAPKKGILVSNGCAYRDELGEDFIITQVSEAHAMLWDKNTAPYLAGYGLPLSAPVIRTTCAGYKVEPKERIFFIPTKEEAAKATPAALPKLDSAEPLAAETLANLHALMMEVHELDVTSMKHPKSGRGKASPTRPKVKLAPEKLQQLRTATGADYVWVISTLETDVSAGKVVGTAVLTALLTMGTYAAAPTGGRQNIVALVDLNEGALVWKKREGNAYGQTSTTATGTTTAPTYQTTNTQAVSTASTDQVAVAKLFEPLLPIGAGIAGQGVGQAAPEAAAGTAPAATPAVTPAAAPAGQK